LEAAADPEQPCVSPVAVLERIEAFCRRDDFDFLRQEPKHGYGDPRGFVAIVRRCWLDRVDDELRRATGLIDETQYRELFGRYVTHVSFWLKKERVQNRLTGEYEDADAELMSSVEEMIGVEDADGFRRDLIGKVAAQAIDHPGAPLDHAALFPALLEKVRGHYFAKHRETIAKIARDALRLLEDGAGLEPERRQRAEAMLQDLEQDYGYQPCSARIALGELVADRYPG
ncbi:MAG: serine protein kinase PrkA, partial [Myxococcales bacterium]|nr:serine protein kinase PrkA [Myxococcales bacterium]